MLRSGISCIHVPIFQCWSTNCCPYLCCSHLFVPWIDSLRNRCPVCWDGWSLGFRIDLEGDNDGLCDGWWRFSPSAQAHNRFTSSGMLKCSSFFIGETKHADSEYLMIPVDLCFSFDKHFTLHYIMPFTLCSRFRNYQTLILYCKRTHKLLAASWTEYPLASLPVEGLKHASTTNAGFLSLALFYICYR